MATGRCSKNTLVEMHYNGGTTNGRFRHGLSYSKEYVSWRNMLQRCTNPKNPKFCNWGGRGIKVCAKWYDFKNFYDDMGPLPLGSRRFTLDRIDNNGNYEPGNCRWVTYAEQLRNRRFKMITIHGVSRKLKDWCSVTKVDRSTYYNNIKNGVPLEHAFKFKKALPDEYKW